MTFLVRNLLATAEDQGGRMDMSRDPYREVYSRRRRRRRIHRDTGPWLAAAAGC